MITIPIGACSKSSKPSGAPLPDAATLLKQSSQTTKTVKSVHLELSVNGKIKGLPIKKLTGDLTTDPTAASGTATLTLSDPPLDANFVVYDSILYAALSAGKWEDYGPASALYDPSAILDPETGLANLLAKMTNTKAEGRETIGGQTTIRITGKVPADAVNQLASQLKATDALPATVWIQETGDHELVQVMLEQSAGNSLQMTLSKWNEHIQVTKPPVSG